MISRGREVAIVICIVCIASGIVAGIAYGRHHYTPRTVFGGVMDDIEIDWFADAIHEKYAQGGIKAVVSYCDLCVKKTITKRFLVCYRVEADARTNAQFDSVGIKLYETSKDAWADVKAEHYATEHPMIFSPDVDSQNMQEYLRLSGEVYAAPVDVKFLGFPR